MIPYHRASDVGGGSFATIGLVAHYAADRITGAHGTPVATWNDVSGNGNNATVSESSPTLDLTSFPRPAVAFSRSTEYGLNTGSLANGACSIFIALRLDASTFSNDYTGILGYGVTLDQGGFFIKNNGKTANYFPQSGGGLANYDGSGAANYVDGMWYVVSVINDISGAMTTYQNGVLDGTAPLDSLGFDGRFLLGDQYVSGRNFGGWIGEILIYETALNTTERELTETYLKNKFGIS